MVTVERCEGLKKESGVFGGCCHDAIDDYDGVDDNCKGLKEVGVMMLMMMTVIVIVIAKINSENYAKTAIFHEKGTRKF